MTFTKKRIERGHDEKLETVESVCGTVVIQKLINKGEKASDCTWGVYFKKEHIGDFHNLKDAKEKASNHLYWY